MIEKQKVTRGWPPKRRAQQAARCKTQNPSHHATGPKTDDGKTRAAQNARTHGMRSKDVLILLSLLAEQNRYLKELLLNDDI